MRSRHFVVSILAIACLSGCKSYSRFPIDSKPKVAIDTALLGMWRCVEDTDKANFIEVQNFHDVYHTEENEHGGIENYLAATIDTMRKQNGPQWDPATDPTIMDTRYEIDNRKYLYYFTYFDNHGVNPRYQQWTVHTAKVNNNRFLNIEYRNPYSADKNEKGWLLVRIIKAKHDSITTAIVADKALKNLKSSKEVRSRITAKLNDRRFYSDTMHFYKINKYHFTLNKAIKLANKQHGQ
jgi:hypothetical protein